MGVMDLARSAPHGADDEQEALTLTFNHVKDPATPTLAATSFVEIGAALAASRLGHNSAAATRAACKEARETVSHRQWESKAAKVYHEKLQLKTSTVMWCTMCWARPPFEKEKQTSDSIQTCPIAALTVTLIL